MPLIINDLNNKYPALILEITEIKTEEVIKQLKSGLLDCGLIATPIEVKGVRFRALFYEKFYVYLSENHSLFSKKEINPSELEDKDLWYLEEGNCFQNQVNTICKFDNKNTTEQNLIYRSNSIESLRQIVESQSGATFIPELATIQIDPSHEDLIKEIEGEPPVREISLAVTKAATKERLVNAFTEIILNNIPGRMLQKPKYRILDTMLSVK
ncbi:MAG: hypothetical protein JW833_08650 [Prolixibacteraceae bacterium]|nr:hypothetical protein [Prolixibacteraceae bacterium]